MRAALIVATVLVATAFAVQDVATVDICLDRVTCDPFTCSTHEVPVGKCDKDKIRSGSFWADCTKKADLCVTRVIYDTPDCLVKPVAQHDLVCGMCYSPRHMRNETVHIRIDCAYDRDGAQSVEVMECDEGCKLCTPRYHIPQLKCTPTHRRGETARFVDFFPCEIVEVARFPEADCTGEKHVEVLATGRCNDGMRVRCH
jgi:hypothetical protein